MALTELRVEGFKRFDTKVTVPLKPLTIVIGQNGTGKSSILQAILLLAQSWERAFDGFVRLQANGSFVDLGTFENVLHAHAATSIGLGCTWSNGRSIDGVWSGDAELQELIVNTGHHDVDLRLRRDTEPGTPLQFIFSPESWEDPPTGARMEGNDAARIRQILRSTNPPAVWSVRADDGAWAYQPLLIAPTDTLSVTQRRHERLAMELASFSQALEPGGAFHRTVAQRYESALETARRQLRAVSFIGPNRLAPRRFYEATDPPPTRVGALGEAFAQMLVSDDVRHEVEGLLQRMHVPFWVRAYSPRAQLRSYDLADVWVTPRQPSHGQQPPENAWWVNLPDVAYGLSQLLPIAVELALMATERDRTLIIQQPELHLNPVWQRTLANEFLRVCEERMGHQIIVETHSTAILERIDEAMCNKPELEEVVEIVHVGESNGRPVVRSMRADGNLARHVLNTGGL